MPGPPGAVRFCMGLGRPGHRSGERAATAAATVGGPPDGKTTKNFQTAVAESAAASNSRQFRTYFSPTAVVVVFFVVVFFFPHAMFFFSPSGSYGELAGDSGKSHCPWLSHCRVFSVPSSAAESSCPSPSTAERTRRPQATPTTRQTVASTNRGPPEEGRRAAAFRSRQEKSQPAKKRNKMQHTSTPACGRVCRLA